MIRVTVELVPGGVGRAEVIAEGVIWNDHQDTVASGGARGSYGYRFAGKRGHALKDRGRGRVVDYPRTRLNVLHLVARCLNEAGFR